MTRECSMGDLLPIWRARSFAALAVLAALALGFGGFVLNALKPTSVVVSETLSLFPASVIGDAADL